MLPNHEEMRQLFNDIYNIFYRKWINQNIPYDANQTMQEARELGQKYEGQKVINIAEMIACIENERSD